MRRRLENIGVWTGHTVIKVWDGARPAVALAKEDGAVPNFDRELDSFKT